MCKDQMAHAARPALCVAGLLCFGMETLGADKSAFDGLGHQGGYTHAQSKLDILLCRAGLAKFRLETQILLFAGGETMATWLMPAWQAAICV